jgi:tight adherence protein B
VRGRVLLLVACVAATFGTLVASAGAAGPKGGGVQLTEARGATFPERAFVVSLPGGVALSAGNVSVKENGGSVYDVTVLPASAVGKKTFGVVLVVDASESMAGTPIEKAMSAARAFAARRNANQQLGLVVFSSAPKVVLPFTTSRERIDAALSQVPSVAYGTHIYDAVAKAEAMLGAAGIQAGSIVVLSDGADTGSQSTGADVAAAARAAHVRLYTIGLNSPKFDATTLASLAASGGGEYTLAKSTQALAPVFDELSQRISREYVVRYKSFAGPTTPVRVSVQVAGVGSASAAYETPALPVKSVAAPYHRSISERFWGSPLLMVLLALIVAGMVALFTYALASTKGIGLPLRMVEFVSVPGLQKDSHVAAGTTDTADHLKEVGFWARLDRSLEIAQIKTTGMSYVAMTVIGTVVAWFLIVLATGSLWWSLLALAVPYGSREFAIRKLARRRNQFSEQLPDALQVISSALRSGHSFAGALAVVVESGSEPMKSEMQRVVADEQLGIPLEQSLNVVAERMASRDLEQVALVGELQREAGGNAAEVVDRVAETIRERFELRRLISTLTAQGRMSRWIVSAVPVVIILILQIINPHYLHPLVSTLGGKIALVFAAGLVIGGSLVIKKIVDIKV